MDRGVEPAPQPLQNQPDCPGLAWLTSLCVVACRTSRPRVFHKSQIKDFLNFIKFKNGHLRKLITHSHSQIAVHKPFVRSGMEYGNMLYMGAADTHLEKLDRIQRSAQVMGGFEV